MKATQIGELAFIVSADDENIGHISRDPTASRDRDDFWWRFYPAGPSKPITAGDLSEIGNFVFELNDELKFRGKQ